MTKDDDANLPALPRQQTPVVAGARDLLSAPAVNGVIQSAISGFVADMRRRSLQKHVKATGAVADLQSERRRAVSNTIELYKERGVLQDLDNILLDEQRQRDEQRTETEHRRWLNEQRRARERDGAVFSDHVSNALHRTELGNALRTAEEAERYAEAATRVSDEEIDRLYLEAATERIKAEVNHLFADRRLAEKQGLHGTEPRDNTEFLDRVIGVVQHVLTLQEDRDASAALREHAPHIAAEIAARLRADFAKKKDPT